MALSTIPGYFCAKLAPTYSTTPTTGGCVVFISGHTGASIGSTVTDTFGPIIVPPGGCVFTGATTNSLKRLSAVAIRPGYNDVSDYYIEGTGATINPQLRKTEITSFDLLTGAATKAANSGRCPTEEDVYEYATKAALISPSEVDEAKRCLSRDEYPLWDTMYTSAVYTKMIPTYSKLYYDCSSNVLSGCSSNDSLICKLDGTLCTSNCRSDCSSDCSSDGTTTNTGKTGTISITFKNQISANICTITAFTDADEVVSTYVGNGWSSIKKNGAEYLVLDVDESYAAACTLSLNGGAVNGPYICKYKGIDNIRFRVSYQFNTGSYLYTTGYSAWKSVDGTTSQSIYVTITTSSFTIS